MERIAKVFASGSAQRALSKKFEVVEPYDAFVVIRASEAQLRSLARKYPVQDITDSYLIASPTGLMRIPEAGKSKKAMLSRQEKSSLKSGPHHYLVQFAGPIKSQWLAEIKKNGGQLRAPHNDFTWIVRADEKSLAKISGLPFVRWTGHLPHASRVSPAITRNPGRQAQDTSSTLPRTRVLPGTYVVEFFGQKELAAAVPKVKRLGFRVRQQDKRANLLTLESLESASIRAAQIKQLSAIHGVRFVRERIIKRVSNDVATGLICSDQVRGNKGLELDGEGEVIAICDTGIDTGNPTTINRDFAGRIAAIKSYPITADFSPKIDNPGADDGPADLDSGHGTHVSGSVLGDGSNSANLAGQTTPIRGLAYRAKLVFQAVEQEMKWKPRYSHNERYELAGIPADLTDVFDYAYRKRARVHSNSWGGGEPGEYDQQCSQLDDFVWKHPDFCIVVAAGNDGSDSDGDGRINPMSVTSPGTAKNCITVGACESLRKQFSHETYGSWWPRDYPVPPFKRDPMADNPNEIVAFSSRGPTADGRTKPEVIAPGTFILSTRSSQIAGNNKGWAAFPLSKAYFYMGGTSMATPLVAGATALARQYYRTVRRLKRPSAALIKATLVAGATRIGNAPQKMICDNDQGFGRVDLGAVLAPLNPIQMQFKEQTPGLKTGDIQSFTVMLKSSKYPMRIVLAYTDAPGPALVNDLNLLLHGPNGEQYVGNQAKRGNTKLDSQNNVEAVNIAKPAAGQWKIEVVGSNVPRGPQPYALVYLGHF